MAFYNKLLYYSSRILYFEEETKWRVERTSLNEISLHIPFSFLR